MGSQNRRQRRAQDRSVRVQPRTTPVELNRRQRILNWARKRWKTVSLMGGVFLLAGAYGGYRYHQYRTLPWAEVGLMGHFDEYDGSVVVGKLRELENKEKVSAIALENMNSTETENRDAINRFERVRTAFNQWRASARPDSETLSREARKAVLSVEQTPVFVPIYTEALLQGIPIRFIESISPEQLVKAKQREIEVDRLFQQAANAPTLNEAVNRMIPFYKLIEEETSERNEEMREELAKVRDEFRGKGTVFAAVGLAHFEFPPTHKTRVVDAFEPGRNLLADPRADYHLPPALRAARSIVGSCLQTALATNPAQRERLKPAYEVSKTLTLEQFKEIDRRVGTKKSSERIQTVVAILLEWAQKR